MSVVGTGVIKYDSTYFSGGIIIMVTTLGNDSPTVRANAVTAWSPFLRSGDYILGTNMSGFWAAMQYNIAGVRIGAEFGTLANISANAAQIKNSGGYMISYDYESGISTAAELNNISGTINSGLGMVYSGQGLQFFIAPGPPYHQSGGLLWPNMTSGHVMKMQWQKWIQSGDLGLGTFVQNQININFSGAGNLPVITQFSAQRESPWGEQAGAFALISGQNKSGIFGIHLYRTADQAGVDWTTEMLRFMRGGAIGGGG